MSTPSPTWTDIGALDNIPVRGARVVRTLAGCIAVFRTSDNEVYAIDDACIVHGKSVTCPLHSWVINLASGAVQDPDEGEVSTYAVKVEAGRVLLDASPIRRAK